MSSNDKIILDQIIETQLKARAPDISNSDFFDMFVAEQALKDFDLSDEEIQSGLVGGSADGGIDGIYTFANGDLIREDFDCDTLKKNIAIEVIIIQSKTTETYNEDAMNRLNVVTKDLFDLSKEVDDFKTIYNEEVRSAVDIFRCLYKDIAARFPRLQFKYIYATKGDTKKVHPNVNRKISDIKETVLSLFSSASFNFEFIGATQLLTLARRLPTTTHEVEVTESLSTKNGYITLVRLDSYFAFICDTPGSLRKTLFESNVRDYQGSIAVNAEIKKSLIETGKEDFWWLNNGITIIASKVVQSGKVLTIEDPQIVNGQQTTTEIYNYFSTVNVPTDTRCVMVRVIVVSESASRDRIIKATNSQTSIPPASLRATDKIHRDIEEYLSPFGIYYDRRKNSQKNLGRPVDKIVSIPLMAQAIMAIVLQRPDYAKARPSTLLNSDNDYKQIFPDNPPIRAYLVASKIIKKIKAYLNQNSTLGKREQTSMLFYIATYAAAILCNTSKPTFDDVAVLEVDELSDDILDICLKKILEIYNKHGGDDKAAKGNEMIKDLKEILAEQFAIGTAKQASLL